jgi:hypothetical protein
MMSFLHLDGRRKIMPPIQSAACSVLAEGGSDIDPARSTAWPDKAFTAHR